METLLLESNEISLISGLQNNKNLKVLSLYNNRINEIQGLEDLPLIELNLGKNLIVSCWRGLNGHILLRKLNISNNQINSLKGLEVLESLRTINIAENSIDKIFELKYIEDLVVLSEIDFS